MANPPGSPGTALAVVALALASAALVFSLSSGRRAARPERDDDRDLADRVSLENRLGDAETRLEASEKRLAEMQARVEKAEKAAGAASLEALKASDLAKSGGAAPRGLAEGESAPVPEGEAERKEELALVLDSIRKGTFSQDSVYSLMNRARELAALDEALAAMETWAADRPTEAAAQVALGTAYVTKLLAVPSGPERGEWAMKSIGAYDAALKIEPENWDAQFYRAFNLSQWPSFLGKQPEAIRGFEKLIEQQEGRGQPEPRYAQTYFQLGTTYREAGNTDKAREVLRRGLEIFPDNKPLREQLEVLEKR